MPEVIINTPQLQLFRSKLKDYIENEKPEKWQTHTVIKDVVYLLGTSVDPKFAFGNGFDKFLEIVLKELDPEIKARSRKG